MKNFVSIFLFLLFLVQTFSSFVLDGMYSLNKDYVAQSLCENKEKPQMHCNGKCYLSKQVAKENSDTKPAAGYKKEKTGEVFFALPGAAGLQASFLLFDTDYTETALASLPNRSRAIVKPPPNLFM